MEHFSLRLKGFIGILSGQAKQEIVLDLKKYAYAELIALAGVNGEGKTTLLDNLHPYLTMPSRASEGGAFSFYSHVGPEAEKEYHFATSDGAHHRQLVTIKQTPKSATMKAYLHTRVADEWCVYVTKNGIASDGSAGTYMQCVEELCGPESLYFTAIHQSQDKRPLHDMTNSDVKSLMLSMLGLGSVLETGNQAKAAASEIDAVLAESQDSVRKALEDIAAKRPKTSQKIEASFTAASALKAQIKSCQEQMGVSELERIRLEASAQNSAAAGIRLVAIDSDIQTRQDQRDKRVKEIDVGSTQQVRAHKTTVESLEAELKSLSVALTVHNQAVSADAIKIARKANALDSQSREPELTKCLAIAVEAEKQAKVTLDDEMRKRQSDDVLAASLKGFKDSGVAQANQLVILEKQAACLEVVPCRGTDLLGRCELLALARDAKASSTEVSIKLVDMRKQYAQTTADRKALGNIQVEAKKLLQAQSLVALEAARQALQLAQKEMQLLPEIMDAEQRTKSAQDLIHVTSQRIAAINVALADSQRAISLIEVQRNKDMEIAIDDSSKAINLLEVERATLQKSDVRDALTAAKKTSENLSKQVDQLTVRLQSELATQMALSQQTTELESLFVKAVAEQNALKGVAELRSQFTLLAKAFGNDGIVALLIDESGPHLASIANDLLLACYGSQFTIEIRTQSKTKSGSIKEGFDIFVHDAKDGSSKNLKVMSGGQKVWIDQCIIRAISIHLATRSGYQYRTLVSDETDGKLDAKRKREFIDMKRKVLAIGGFKQEIFISQTPELWELADAVIHVSTL
jgi:DNA repair protein SbcC/Rad50